MKVKIINTALSENDRYKDKPDRLCDPTLMRNRMKKLNITCRWDRNDNNLMILKLS